MKEDVQTNDPWFLIGGQTTSPSGPRMIIDGQSCFANPRAYIAKFKQLELYSVTLPKSALLIFNAATLLPPGMSGYYSDVIAVMFKDRTISLNTEQQQASYVLAVIKHSSDGMSGNLIVVLNSIADPYTWIIDHTFHITGEKPPDQGSIAIRKSSTVLMFCPQAENLPDPNGKRQFEYHELELSTGTVMHYSTGIETAYFGSRKLVHMLEEYFIGGSVKQSDSTQIPNERLAFAKVKEGTGEEWMYAMKNQNVQKIYTVDYMMAWPFDKFIIAYAQERQINGQIVLGESVSLIFFIDSNGMAGICSSPIRRILAVKINFFPNTGHFLIGVNIPAEMNLNDVFLYFVTWTNGGAEEGNLGVFGQNELIELELIGTGNLLDCPSSSLGSVMIHKPSGFELIYSKFGRTCLSSGTPYCSITKYNWAPWDRVNNDDGSFYIVNTDKRYDSGPIIGFTSQMDDVVLTNDFIPTFLVPANNQHFIIVPIRPEWALLNIVLNAVDSYYKYYGDPVDTYEIALSEGFTQNCQYINGMTMSDASASYPASPFQRDTASSVQFTFNKVTWSAAGTPECKPELVIATKTNISPDPSASDLIVGSLITFDSNINTYTLNMDTIFGKTEFYIFYKAPFTNHFIYSVKHTLINCKQKTINYAVATETSFIIGPLTVKSGFQFTFDTSIYDRMIATHANCPIDRFELWENNTPSTLWTNATRISLIPTQTVSGLQPQLKILPDVKWFRILKLKAFNMGEAFNEVTLTIRTCGYINEPVIASKLSTEVGPLQVGQSAVIKRNIQGILSTTHSNCPIERFVLYDDQNKDVSTTSSVVQVTTELVNNMLEPVLQFNTNTPFILLNYKLEAIANGGQTGSFMLSKMYTCSESTTVVSEPSIYPQNPFTRDTTSSVSFTFDKFTTDQVSCPINKMFLVSQTRQIAADASIIVFPSALTCDFQNKCVVNLDNKGGTWEFYIYMEANGGAFKYSSKKFTIIIPEAQKAFYDSLTVINNPPTLSGQVKTEIKVEAIINSNGTLENAEDFRFISPRVIDPENNKILMKFSGNTDLQSVIIPTQTKNNEFSVIVKRTLINDKNKGIYPLTVEIGDEMNPKSITVSINIELFFANNTKTPELEPVKNETSPETSQSSSTATSTGSSKTSNSNSNSQQQQSQFQGVIIPKEDQQVFVPPPPPTFNVAGQVDQFGNLTVKFNQKLQIPENLKGLKSSRVLQENRFQTLEDIITLQFKPDSEKSGVADIQFEELTESEIKYKANFSNPNEISLGFDSDKIEVKVNQFKIKELFKTKDGQDLIIAEEISTVEFLVDIPVQIRNDDQAVATRRRQVQTTETLNNALVFNMILSYAFNSILSQIWSIANILQVITLYPLIEVTFSPNTIEIFNAIYEVVSFEIIPWVLMSPIYTAIIGEFPSDIPFNSGFQRLGFDGYITSNLFSPFFTACLFGLSYIYNFLAYKCFKNKEKRRKNLQKFKGFYAFLLRLWLEMSLEIGVCSMMEIAMRQVNEPKEKISFFISFFSLIGSCFLVSYTYDLLHKKFYKIKHEEYPRFNMYWSELWSDLKLVKNRPPVFYLIFVIRRFVYSAIIVVPCLFEIPPIFQMMMVIVLNLIMTAWLMDKKPFITPKLNYVEQFNEFMNLSISLMLIVQNNNVGGDDLYEMGVWVNNLIMLLFLANVVFVLMGLSTDCIKKCQRKKMLKQRREEKQEVVEKIIENEPEIKVEATVKEELPERKPEILKFMQIKDQERSTQVIKANTERRRKPAVRGSKSRFPRGFIEHQQFGLTIIKEATIEEEIMHNLFKRNLNLQIDIPE